MSERSTRATDEDVQLSFRRLSQYLESVGFRGHEYDDLLASPLVRPLSRLGLYPAIAAVQVSKRFPIDLRGILGVPKLYSTKAWGFIIKGYLCHHLATGDERYLGHVRQGLDWLAEHRAQEYSGHCWGNDFDFASRAGFMPKGLPTIVWSSHIQEAFDLAFRVFRDTRYRDIVVSVADFVELDLERMPDSTGCCLAYAPGVKHPVHNSNLLGVVALLRAWRYERRDRYYALASQALSWSLARINHNGSWYYGATEMLHWIDNYHTGYVLDCLCSAQDIAGDEFVGSNVIRNTYMFWREHFFELDGRPRFYHDRLYPIDIQATAQAIESFSKYAARDPSALDHARRVAGWAIRHMQKENGSFRYRIYRRWTNELEAIHWGQGTMLSALGHLMLHSRAATARANDIHAN
jgi:polysaccharide biosynthesis protein VpsJ